MNKIKNKWILILVSCFFVFTAKSQSFYAQVSSKKVQVGVPFEYAIVLTVSGNNFIQPSFKDFEIVGGPNESRNIQNVNGNVTQQTVLSYGLVAKKEGKLTIGPASVMSGGQKLETNPITLEVVKGNVGSANEGVSVDDGDIFIKATTTKTKLYVGEQLIVTHKLYSRYNLLGPKKLDPAVFDGFWAKRIDITGVAQQENVDGVVYLTGEVEKNSLYATAPGKYVIKSVKPIFVIRKITNKKPKNILEQIFGGQSYEDMEVEAKSNALTIEVLPLPEEGKPANFGGAVGKFDYKITTNKQSISANDALNIKVTISGSGNLSLINPPKINLPESFELYDPKITESGNSKTFDYLVIPRSEGEFKLNKMDFSYFNLETKKYVTVSPPEINIKVLPPDPNSKGAQVYVQQSQVKETENDIRYIKKGDFVLMKSETEFFNSTTHILLLILSVVILGTGLFLRRNYIKNNSNMVLVKERKAGKMAKKQLMNAEKLMQQNKKDEFYTEILTALNNYISSKLNIPVADLSREKITNVLTQKQVDVQDINKLVSTLETSEYAKYAPGAVSGDLQQVYKDTVDLITGLEEQINKKV